VVYGFVKLASCDSLIKQSTSSIIQVVQTASVLETHIVDVTMQIYNIISNIHEKHLPRVEVWHNLVTWVATP
jgi:hypothetical protein